MGLEERGTDPMCNVQYVENLALKSYLRPVVLTPNPSPDPKLEHQGRDVCLSCHLL